MSGPLCAECSYHGRMKRTNAVWRLLIFLILAIALPSFAEKVSTIPAPTGYIDDYAQVFSDSGKSNMEALSRELHDKTKAQAFVVTVNTTEGEPVETFANELFAKWKIGEKKTDRGILMLFAIKDRKRWIEVGYGFEGILNDAKVGDIGRTMVPALQAANYDDAAETGLRQITQVIATDDAGVTLDALADPAHTEPTAPAPVTGPPPSSSSLRPGATIFLTILFFTFPVFIICFVIWRISTAVRRGTWTRGNSGYDTGSSFGASDTFGSSDSGGDSFGGATEAVPAEAAQAATGKKPKGRSASGPRLLQLTTSH
jgi:uncharacterized protein